MKLITIFIFYILKMQLCRASPTDTLMVFKKDTVFYPTGEVMIVRDLKSMVRHGVQKEFFKNGQLKSERTYFNDKCIGEIKEYFENGNLQKHYQINNLCKTDGFFYSFNSNGTDSFLGNIKECSGFLIEKDSLPNIKIIAKDTIKWYIDYGLCRRFNEEGVIAEEGKYEEFYFETILDTSDGGMNYVVEKRLPVKTGEWKYYSNSGILIKEEQWVRGEMVERKEY